MHGHIPPFTLTIRQIPPFVETTFLAYCYKKCSPKGKFRAAEITGNIYVMKEHISVFGADIFVY